MKLTKILALTMLAVAFVAAPAFAETCCDKAKAKGEECKHKCCVEAKKAGKACDKCCEKKDEGKHKGEEKK